MNFLTKRKSRKVKATIRYSNYLNDFKIVNKTLAEENLRILKFKYNCSVSKVKIEVNSLTELNQLVSKLCERTEYGVTIVKCKIK